MTSPYVRRRRLADELRKIREDRDLTTDDVARLIYRSRTKISKLENAQIRPDLAEIITLLEALGVTGKQYEKIFQLARDAARKNWWDSFGNAMGSRQRLAADLEHGAAAILDFNLTGIPAVLQTPEMIRSLIDLDRQAGLITYRPERMFDARLHRQRHLLASDGPKYDAVLDETVIHRLGVPRRVMSAQLRHAVALLSATDHVTLRVLRHDAHLTRGPVSLSSFFVYTFPEKADPPLAVVDLFTTDLVLTDRREVAVYTRHYDLVRQAALSPEDTLTLLIEIAKRLDDRTGSSL